jgi:hypothetical protein
LFFGAKPLVLHHIKEIVLEPPYWGAFFVSAFKYSARALIAAL